MARLPRLVAYALVASLAVVAGCGSDTGSGDEEPLTIGFFSPTTGMVSSAGVNARNGAMLAVEKLNTQRSAGEPEIRLVTFDDENDPEEAEGIARRLTQDEDVAAVVSGSTSPPTTAAAPVFQDANVPMLSAFAVSPKITQAGDYVFTFGPASAVEAAAAALFIAEDLAGDPQRVGLIGGELDPFVQLTDAFDRVAPGAGLEVVAAERFEMSTIDFRPLLRRLMEGDPDVVYAAAYYDGAARLLGQAREIGLTVPFVFGSVADSYRVFNLAPDNAAEGAYLTTVFARDDAAQEFIDGFEIRYGHPPDIVAATSYDAVLAVAQAARDAGDTAGPRLRDAISGLVGVEEAVTGPIEQVTLDRLFARPLRLEMGREGTWVHVANLPWASATGLGGRGDGS